MLPPAIKDLLQRQRRQLREAEKAHRDLLKDADQLASALRRVSDLIVRAYRLVHGTQPRARRRTVAKQTSHDTDSPYTSELRVLIERAQHGDQTAMPELREQLDSTADLWQQVGDLAKHVETAWIKLLAGNDVFTQECLQREAERRRTELLGDDPTAIERHLIETIVASWLQLKHAELQMGSRDATDKQLTFRHRRLDSAQKQHRSAINQLVKVREVTVTKKQKPSDSTHKSGEMKRSPKRARRRVVAA
jgi:hypothetical protein